MGAQIRWHTDRNAVPVTPPQPGVHSRSTTSAIASASASGETAAVGGAAAEEEEAANPSQSRLPTVYFRSVIEPQVRTVPDECSLD